jgi:hypothetical protein
MSADLRSRTRNYGVVSEEPAQQVGVVSAGILAGKIANGKWQNGH